MPLLNKSMWLAAFTSCVFGMCCADLIAQTAPGASGKTASGSGRVNLQTQPRGKATLGPPAKVAGVPGPAPLNQRPPQANNRPPLPQGQAMRIPKLSPEMEDILVEWEQKSAQIKRLEGTFIRTTYDSVFGVELVSEGKYCFQFPDQGSFHQFGVAPKVEGQKGHRFAQKAGPDERWVCDGTKILKIDDKAKQYESVDIPEPDRGQNIRNSPLPFLFGMKAIEAKQRYAFELNTDKTDANSIWLKVYPLQQMDLANYKKAEVILNRSNCLPRAVKLYDGSGAKEDVYVFDQKNMTVNSRTWSAWFTRVDPLKPELGRYKRLIQNENAAAPTGRQIAKPAGNKALGPKPQIQRTAQVPDDEEPPARATVKKKVQP